MKNLKREFVISTVFEIEDVEAAGFDDQKVYDMLAERLTMFQDAVNGSVGRELCRWKDPSVPTPQVSFQKTTIRMKVTRR